MKTKPQISHRLPVLRLYFTTNMRDTRLAQLLDKMIPLEFSGNHPRTNSLVYISGIAKGEGATIFISYIGKNTLGLTFGTERDNSWERDVPIRYDMSNDENVAEVFRKIGELISDSLTPAFTIGKYEVEKKEGGLQVGCTFVTKDEVRKAYDLLFA